MKEIEFHIGTDCPFCSQQSNNTLTGSKTISYNHIYCSYCRLSENNGDEFDSKFEMWFLEGKLISVIISDYIGGKCYYSEYSPLQKAIVVHQNDEEYVEKNIELKKWNLKNHMDILYKSIEDIDLLSMITKPGASLKIKEILDNPHISNSVKARLFKLSV